MPDYDAFAIYAEIADMADSFGDDYAHLADITERDLEADPDAAKFDPPDPAYWRAVIAELRRRAAQEDHAPG